MKEKFLTHTKREYSAEKRTIALMMEGIVFLCLVPAALVYFSARLDLRFALPSLAFGLVNYVLGFGITVAGFLLGWWSAYTQFTVGRGTPIPVMATQQLIVQKPYSYCRNPMALGAITAYFGIAILLGSISAVGIVLVFAVILLTYIKLLEEKELELRFGDAYRAYRKQTPFIIPRFRSA